VQDILGESLRKLKKIRARKNRMIGILLVLSLIVSLDVFWVLRQPGLTLAGDADCGILEHTHDDTCHNAETPCLLEEHVHDISCYSDETADVETPLDWQKTFADYPYTGDLRKDLVGIAKTQVGYSESILNFEMGSDGVRRGYNRYGAWYGTPYTDWSAIFVSFCLHYAGADPSTTPGNTGANSMAELWKGLGKYAAVGEYVPIAGDLVFYNNNTVGIVTEINAFTFCVVRGDVEGTVQSEVVDLTDDSISGWGITVEIIHSDGSPKSEESIDITKEPATEELVDITKEPTSEELLDITNGPAFFIFEGGTTQEQTQLQLYSLKSSRAIINLVEYLEANGGNYFFTLLDTNNQELPKDEKGNYIVRPDTAYKLTISVTSPEGFVPGTYQYQTPNGLLVDGGAGTFILKDGTNVGDWNVTDEGLITLNFNEHMNSRTEITISATMGIHFPEQEDPIDFDGKIGVTIVPPDEPEITTKLNKWGKQGVDDQGQDASKLYWTMEIMGQKDSHIPGSIITDQITTGDHRYTQSDMAGGLRFGAGHYDLETGEQIAWYAWDVPPDDPNLTWTETGWTYKMPEVVQSKWYNDPVTLGNDGWIYYIEYTSTPDPRGTAGSYWYTNSATVDGQYVQGWGEFVHGETQAGIIKHGSFHGDADGGFFLWELQASIPGMKAGESPVYLWQIQDYMRIKNETNDTVGYIENSVDLATVTATRGGQTVSVPHINDATANDDFAWFIEWTADHGDGVYYLKALTPLCRCRCSEENCEFWNRAGHYCESQYWYSGGLSGFCRCWTEENDTILTFTYETDDLSVVNSFGGLGYDLENEVLLQNHKYLPDGTLQATTVGDAQAKVPIPGVFKKELTHDFNGYTANYNITVNEAKLVLTDGSPLTIHDVMTETLVYISGSLVITAEDANGNITTLKQGVDYTVEYDGTGGATDAHGRPVHILDIVILRPQPVTYILDYDATLTIPTGVTEAIKYTNSASITLWGQKISDTTAEKVYADINIAAKNYKVEMFKTCALTGEPLGGATFGLFNAQGGLITTEVTDEKGELLFQSNIIEGIILREHVLYYMQELAAPPGYQLDDTMYWFCFCNETDDTCKTCAEIMEGKEVSRIPFEQIGKVHATNQLMNYDLPSTGGPGIYPLMLASVICIITPLVYRFIRRRKRERRGVG